jgi:peptide deformylase
MKKSTEDIQDIDRDLEKLAQDMFETMYIADGIGLAANQVGVSKSLVVIDTSAATEKNDQNMY